MNRFNSTALVVAIAFAAIAATVYGAQPPDVVSTDVVGNTAMGSSALVNLTVGTSNTASGFNALYFNTTGYFNTAYGASSLVSNTTGYYNTASGVYALLHNTAGTYNTASGVKALLFNTTGSNNTASGASALSSNTIGANNTASGFQALYNNTTGSNNTAVGYQVLVNSTTGSGNAAHGNFALYLSTTGTGISAFGNYAMQRNSTGKYNTAVGWHAGQNLTTGNDNVDIANSGVAAESQTMRLGKQGVVGVMGSGVMRTFIAGVSGVTTGLAGAELVIDANGQLGTISSSRRYKQDIEPMASASERLLKLRPVKFRYKQPDAEGEKPIQYGLIAEEVAEVFPELVIRDKDGQPKTVAYHLLPAILLNELQKEHRLNQQHSEKLAVQASELAELRQLVATLVHKSRETQVAMR